MGGALVLLLVVVATYAWARTWPSPTQRPLLVAQPREAICFPIRYHDSDDAYTLVDPLALRVSPTSPCSSG